MHQIFVLCHYSESCDLRSIWRFYTPSKHSLLKRDVCEAFPSLSINMNIAEEMQLCQFLSKMYSVAGQ